MMAKSILVSENTHRKLILAKMELGFKSMEEMLAKMAVELDKAKFLQTSESFRKRMREKSMNIEHVARSGESIRIELLREWFKRP